MEAIMHDLMATKLMFAVMKQYTFLNHVLTESSKPCCCLVQIQEKFPPAKSQKYLMTVRISTPIKILAVNYNDRKSIFDMVYFKNVIIYYLVSVLQWF
jgi:hypothetical protein